MVGIYATTDVALELSKSLFQHNFVDGYGGAIGLEKADNSIIHDSSFLNNTATKSGSAVAITASSGMNIYGNTFLANHAWISAAVYWVSYCYYYLNIYSKIYIDENCK